MITNMHTFARLYYNFKNVFLRLNVITYLYVILKPYNYNFNFNIRYKVLTA